MTGNDFLGAPMMALTSQMVELEFGSVEVLGDGKFEITITPPGAKQLTAVVRAIVDQSEGIHLNVSALDNDDLPTFDFVVISAIVAKHEQKLGKILTNPSALSNFAPMKILH